MPFLHLDYQQIWAEWLNAAVDGLAASYFFFWIVFQISIVKFAYEAAKTQLTGESEAAVEDDFKWAWDT